MLVRHANPIERIAGWSDSLHGYPAGASYQCPQCGAATEFPKPGSELDSFVAEDTRQLFDMETQAKRIPHSAAVDFHCQGCLLPVRVLLDHFEDGKSLDSWSVVGILDRLPEVI